VANRGSRNSSVDRRRHLQSTDGGDTWTNMGLKNSERIVKVIVDQGFESVYACVPQGFRSDSADRRPVQDVGRRQELVVDPQGREPVDRLRVAVDGRRRNPSVHVRRHDFPPQRLDVPFRRRRCYQAERERMFRKPSADGGKS
jgi:hypothetical protein